MKNLDFYSMLRVQTDKTPHKQHPSTNINTYPDIGFNNNKYTNVQSICKDNSENNNNSNNNNNTTSWASLRQLKQLYKGPPIPSSFATYPNIIPPNYLRKNIQYIYKKKSKKATTAKNNKNNHEHPGLKEGGSFDAYQWYQKQQKKKQQWYRKNRIRDFNDDKKGKKKLNKKGKQKAPTTEHGQRYLELQETRFSLQHILDVLPKAQRTRPDERPGPQSSGLSITTRSFLITGRVIAENEKEEIIINEKKRQTVKIIHRLIEVKPLRHSDTTSDNDDNNDDVISSCSSYDSNIIDTDCLTRNDIDILELYTTQQEENRKQVYHNKN